MGQKVSPVGLRIGIIKDWKSKWYANKKDYPEFLYEDMKIRDFLFKKLPNNTVGSIEIERNNKNINVKIYTSKPGQIIGRGGSDIDKLRLLLKKQINKEIYIDVIEIKKQFLSAKLVARNIAEQIEKRVSFRIAQKRAISSVMKSGAKGIKTAVSGRLGGADMARTEGYTEGNVPLHTLRADIDYAHEEADTTYGKIGVKVWIYTKEVLNKKKNNNKTLKLK